MQIRWYHNNQGPIISTTKEQVIEIDGSYFKDLAGTGEFLPYEDWRLPANTRAEDLAKRLSIEEMAGLMLYSSHQMIPGRAGNVFSAKYGGRDYDKTVNQPWELSDQQIEFLSKDHLRHVLVVKYENIETAVEWNNNMQTLVENQPWGIPINFSSDPRHSAEESTAEYKNTAADTSKWPGGIGISATFSPATCKMFAEIASKEYRALGITTSLAPQVDLATEPRWMRAVDTFGGQTELALAMAKAYCDGMQTTIGSDTGWGSESVISMAKHWPGGGTGEGGRDAHYWFGKYNVYPGESFLEHLKPFTEGALSLEGPTKQARAIMPYYSISHGQGKEETGNSYNEYLIKTLLRGKYRYDGVVCTDWDITGNPPEGEEGFNSRSYGAEKLTVAERHLKIIMNGVDQFGGNNDIGPIIEAFKIGSERYGEDIMRARYEEAAVRLLTNIFLVGLFENPYLILEDSKSVLGCDDFVAKGYQAQLDSLVLLKNEKGFMPRGKKVYIPKRHREACKNFFRRMDPVMDFPGMKTSNVKKYYEIADTPETADFALVVIESPISDPYVEGEYRPISLQFEPYKADAARASSIAGDRSYKGKESVIANYSDYQNLKDMRAVMGDKPVITIVQMNTAMVMAEVEPLSDLLLISYGVEECALLDVITGERRAGGRLPQILPKNMDTVEGHSEDIFDDIAPYIDTNGNIYSFGFSLNL